MTPTVERLKAEMRNLSEEEREELAQFLLCSLDGVEEEPDVKAAWVAELARRGKEIENGTVVGIPAEQVLAELRGKYQ